MAASRMQVDAQPIRGVLWKRRDVFMNSWRPRWFDLQPEQGLLTYYLLSGNTSGGTHTPLSPELAIRTSNQHPYFRSSSIESTHTNVGPPTPLGPLPREMLRFRATSWDSAVSSVSENSVDYDVVPRGSIYLWGGGCTVAINDNLSRPNEHLYAFSIRTSDKKLTMVGDYSPSIPVDDASVIHLAARTPELRDEWVRKIQNVCIFGQGTLERNGTISNPVPSPSGNMLNARRRSNSRGRLQQELQLQEPILEETNADIHSNGGGDIDESFSEQSSPPRLVSQIPDADASSRGDFCEIQPWEGEEIFNRNSPVYDNVPEPFAKRIREKIRTYLSMLRDGEASEKSSAKATNLQWKRVHTRKKPEHRNLDLSAYQSRCTENGGKEDDTEGKKYSIIRSEATLPHPAKQIFDLIADVSRRMEYETNIQSTERMKRYNYHTSLDYYASTAVWPTAAREFIVVFHWQVITRHDGEKAIIMISFSCPEAEAMRPVAPNHVRAFLLISMYIIRDMGDDKTHITRLLSYDLGGNVNQQLSNVVLMQQANMPVVIADHLKKKEPGPFESRLRTSGLLSNDDVIQSIVKRHSGFDETNIFTETNIESESFVDIQDEINSEIPETYDSMLGNRSPVQPSSLQMQAVLLLAPVFLHRLTIMLSFQAVSVPLFCISLFLAIRQVVLMQFVRIRGLSDDSNQAFLGSVRCRFFVDLKGVLRFIANKKEEREEFQTAGTEVSIVHIVSAALSRALKKEYQLNYKRIRIPWLLVDELVDASAEPVSVSVLDNKGIATVDYADSLNVQQIANELTRQATKRVIKASNSDIGRCLVISSPPDIDDEFDFVETDIVPYPGSGIVVVAVLGEVKLDRRVKHGRHSNQKHSPENGTPKPVLELSLTMIPAGTPHLADTNRCWRFADEVQKLLRFPEMCDV